MSMKAKRYGGGGNAVLVRMSQQLRDVWDEEKSMMEKRLGRKVSHSYFIANLLAGYHSKS